MSTSHYETLGVARDASAEEIEQAYRRLRKRVHPDAQGSHGLFIHVQNAYETLSDPQKRRAYDAGIREPTTGPGRETGPERGTDPTNDRPPTGAAASSGGRSAVPPPALQVSPLPSRIDAPVRYEPPLMVPEPESSDPERGHRVAGWAKITFIALAAIGLFMGFVTFLNGLGTTGVESRSVTNAVVITVFFMIIAVLPVIITKAIPRRLPQPEPIKPLTAADVVLPEHIDRRVFGRPGAVVPAGQDEHAIIGRWGEERVARFLEQTLLPAIGSARLLHGVRAGESIDHVIVADNRVLLIDSTLRQDGRYVWDDHQLWLDGNPIGGSRLSGAAAELSQMIIERSPRYQVHAYLLLHCYGADPNRPEVRSQPQSIGPDRGSGRVTVEAGNPKQFLASAYRFLSGAEDPSRVDLHLLRMLLSRTEIE